MSEENFQPTDLADIIPDDHASNVQPEQTPAPEPQLEQPSEPTGVTAEAENPPAESESPSEDPRPETPQSIPFAAYQNERQQRQEAQQQAQLLHQQLMQLQQPHQEQPQEIDPWDNLEGALQNQAQTLESKLQNVQAQQAEQMDRMRIEMSEEMMRSRYEDYDQTSKIFEDAILSMPPQQAQMLYQQMRQAPMPAKFAYDMAKQMQTMQQVGSDPAAYREQVRQELLAEMQQGQQPGQSQPSQRAPVPTSLAGVPNAAPASTPVAWQGPTPLSKLIPE